MVDNTYSAVFAVVAWFFLTAECEKKVKFVLTLHRKIVQRHRALELKQNSRRGQPNKTKLHETKNYTRQKTHVKIKR